MLRLNNLTTNFWQNFLVKVVDDFIYNGKNFNQIAEMNNTTIANKLDMSFDLYIKRNMHAVEWKVNAIINKDESLINNLNRIWRQPLFRKFNHVTL